MVGVSFNIFALDQTEQLLTSVSPVPSCFARLLVSNSKQLRSEIRQQCSFEITEMKRFSEDFRNNHTKVCKILALNSICLIFPILVVACYCWKVENRYHVQPVHTSVGRCLSRQLQCILEIHQSREKSYVSLYCLLFKYRTWPKM